MADEQNQQGPGYFDQRRISREQKKINESAQAYKDLMDEASFATNNLVDNLKEVAKESQLSNETFRQFLKSTRDISSELSNNADLLDKIKEGELDIYDVQEKQKEAQEKVNTLRSKAAQLQSKLEKSLESGKVDIEGAVKMESAIKGVLGQADNLEAGLGEAMDTALKGNTKLAQGLKGVGGIFSKLGKEGTGKTFSNMAASVQKAKLAGKGFAGQMMAATKAARLNPIVLLGTALLGLFKTMLSLNNEVAELGRSFGVSNKEAGEIRGHFQAVAAQTARLGVEYRDVMQQNMAFNKALGVSSVLSKDITGEAAVLAKRMNMAQESITGFMMAAIGTGQATETVVMNSIKGARAAEEELGVRLDLRGVLEESAKIGGQLRGIFGANLELISKAVGKAKGLGMTLGQVASASKNLLDFQSSISAEMEAELFLGRQLNLEQARLASLTGDYDTFMSEIVKNAGDFFTFSKMNVLQQEKLASALGMNADQLADMLFTQESMTSLQERARTETDAQVKAQLEQLSVQQQFNAAMEKLKFVVINLVSRLERGLANSFFFKYILGISEEDFQIDKSLFPEQETLDSGRQVVGAASNRIPVNDFIIETHPKDTLVMAGGTRLGENNNNANREQLNELINATKSSRSFRYDGFAAVKEAGHYGTKFS